MHRRLATALLAAPLALLAACTGGPGDPAASPAPSAEPARTAVTASVPAAPTTGTVRTTMPPARSPSAPTASPSRPQPAARPVPPRLAALRTCPGCHLVQVWHHARPDISVAVLARKADPTAEYGPQTGYLLTFRTTTGWPVDLFQVRGDFFELDGRPSYPLRCDALRHCLLPAAIGAHSAMVTVIRVAADGSITLVTDDFGTEGTDIRVRDRNGDGTDEIILLRKNPHEVYAIATPFWQVIGWRGDRYVSLGCAPWRDNQTEPRTLSPSACLG
jgi:hypothetical protein